MCIAHACTLGNTLLVEFLLDIVIKSTSIQSGKKKRGNLFPDRKKQKVTNPTFLLEVQVPICRTPGFYDNVPVSEFGLREYRWHLGK